MYVADTARLLRRRWVSVVAGVMVTAALVVGVHAAMATDHRATGQMMLILPPQATGAGTPTNPYLNQPAGLTTTAALIAGNLSTPDARRDLAAQGDSSGYEIAVVIDAGPLLQITATDHDPAAAMATRDAVMASVDRQLAAIQTSAAVPPDQVMTTARYAVSRRADAVTGPKTRAEGAALVLGLLLTLLLAVGIDKLDSSRRVRRAARRSAPQAPLAQAPVAQAPVVQADDGDVPSRVVVTRARPFGVRSPRSGRVRGGLATTPRDRTQPTDADDSDDAEVSARPLAG